MVQSACQHVFAFRFYRTSKIKGYVKMTIYGHFGHFGLNLAVRDPVRENLNFKGFEKKTWTPPRFLHRGPKKAVEHDSDIHFDLT